MVESTMPSALMMMMRRSPHHLPTGDWTVDGDKRHLLLCSGIDCGFYFEELFPLRPFKWENIYSGFGMP